MTKVTTDNFKSQVKIQGQLVKSVEYFAAYLNQCEMNQARKD